MQLSPRHVVGSVLLRLNLWRDAKRFSGTLRNGRKVWEQRRNTDAGLRDSVIKALDFKNGPCFRVSDGTTAAYCFEEIFLEDHYPKRLLRGAKTIVDIGANIGLFSYYARLQCPEARIISFEADPETFEVLSHNMQSLSVECFHKAVSSQEGHLAFFSSPTSGWSSMFPREDGRRIEVQATPLSSFLKAQGIETVDFLKIDVEGAEYDILLGDKNLDLSQIKTLVVEADRSPRDNRYCFEELVQYLRGYFNIEEEKGDSKYPMLVCTRIGRC